MKKFDNELRNELDLMLKHYNHNQKLLSFNEVLLDNKLTAHILKENASMQKTVDLYNLLIKNEKDINFLENEIVDLTEAESVDFLSEIDRLNKINFEIKDKIMLAFSENKNNFESACVEIISKGAEQQFFEFLVSGIKNCCKLNNYEVTATGDNSCLILNVCGFDALQLFLNQAGIHRASVFGKESDIWVFVYKSYVQDANLFSENDIKVEVFRSGGHGGQGVNTTDSAVRVTHLKTKISVECQDERSQIQNKQKAIELLKQKVLNFENKKRNSYVYEAKKQQIKQIEHNYVCRFYDFTQKVVYNKSGEINISFDDFLNGKI